MKAAIWAFGLMTICGAVYALLPELMRFLLRACLWPRYDLRIRGREHVPRRGPVLVAANHVSWIDGFLLAAALPRSGRALVNGRFINLPILRQLAIRGGVIPLPSGGPHGPRAAIAAARAAIDRGELLLIFPEGQLSRNGLLSPFRRGVEVILKGHDGVPVVPAYLGGVWGSVFSFWGGSTLDRRPRGWRRRVTVTFGPPLAAPATAVAIRQAVQEASAAVDPGRPPETIDASLPRWDHPTLGLLAGTTADYDRGQIRQVGQKAGTLGQAVPGVAIRAVDEDGVPLGPDASGSLQVLRPGRGWVDSGQRGQLDRDGFVSVERPGASAGPIP